MKLPASSDSRTKLSATCSLRMNLTRPVSSCSLNLQLLARLYQFTSLIWLADRHKLSEKEALWKLRRLTSCLPTGGVTFEYSRCYVSGENRSSRIS